MGADEKRHAEQLQKIATEIAGCTACPLSRTRHKTVPGEGSPTAEILFIGEGPGYHEDQQGRPFIGAAGQFLTELLASIGLSRNDVFISNVVKCRPPNNRDPLPEELSACDHFLQEQIGVLRPRIVVTLGRFSMAKFFASGPISKIHGQPRKEGGVIYLPLFHPAAALHQPALRRLIEEDFKRIPALLEELRSEASAEVSPAEAEPTASVETATQLSLF
ncbi:MAG TPA: uracil-DNA glycosylase [Chloroflexota bacterium]|nr:uracil-DNA glycosylase [Chloroflexota bacterium]